MKAFVGIRIEASALAGSKPPANRRLAPWLGAPSQRNHSSGLNAEVRGAPVSQPHQRPEWKGGDAEVAQSVDLATFAPERR